MPPLPKLYSDLPEPLRNQFLGLLGSVHDDPDDDAPRLILADWLEDHGGQVGEDWAALIRAQIEYFRLDDRRCSNDQGGMSPRLFVCEGDDWTKNTPRRCTRCRLVADTHCVFWKWQNLPREIEHPTRPLPPSGIFMQHVIYMERGFVRECGGFIWDGWQRYGPGIIALHPVQLVTIHDAPLERGQSRPHHWFTDLHRLPDWFRKFYGQSLPPKRQTHEDATAWLSSRLIAWAKLTDCQGDRD